MMARNTVEIICGKHSTILHQVNQHVTVSCSGYYGCNVSKIWPKSLLIIKKIYALTLHHLLKYAFNDENGGLFKALKMVFYRSFQ
jgi:hypothetical protein